MKNSILELYYGNIDAQAGQTVITTELRNNLKVLSNKEEQLRSTLSGDTLKLFEEYVELYNKFTAISSADGFIGGFKLGARITYDTFAE